MGCAPPKKDKGGLEQYLDELAEAVRSWLLLRDYEGASPDKQREMRRKALVPNHEAEMPEAYRIWRLCRDTPWWPGGVSDQPHLQLMEFAVCASAYEEYQQERLNLEAILRGD